MGLINRTATTALTVLYFVLAVLICVLNGLVVLAYVRFRQIRRRTINLLTTALAAADLVMGLVMLEYGLSNIWPPRDKARCLFELCIMYVTGIASVLTLITIATDRFVNVLYPFSYDGIMRRRRVVWAVASVWAYAALLGCMPVWWNSWRDGGPKRMVCHLSTVIPEGYKIMISLAVLGLSVLCCGAMYLRIALEIVGQRRRLLRAPFAPARHTFRSTKAQMIIFGLFAALWLPVTVAAHYELSAQHNATTATVISFVKLFGVLNSLINPIVYAVRLHDYQSAIRILLRSSCARLLCWRAFARPVVERATSLVALQTYAIGEHPACTRLRSRSVDF